MPKKRLVPGTILQSGQAVVDAKYRIRTLPSGKEARQRVLDAIQRKTDAQKRAKIIADIDLPKTLPRRTVIKILDKMGFKKRRGSGPGQYFHPKYRVLTVPAGAAVRSGQIIIRRSRFGRVVRDYLLSGGKL